MVVDQIFDLNVDVPIDLTLTPNELQVDKVRIPIDTELFVDDIVPVETTFLLDTKVKSVLGISIPVKGVIPIKASLPIKQKVRVKDELLVALKDFRAPLKMTLPVRAKVPVKQSLHIAGTVKVPIQQTVPIHIRKMVGATLPDPVSTSITLGNTRIPVALKANFESEVAVKGSVPVDLGTLHIQKESIRVKLR